MVSLARCVPWTTTAIALLAARAATAASPSGVAAAQGLYDEARKLMSAGQYAAACPKLEESQRLDKSLSTEFHLADCYDHTGRPASAWALFLQVATEAKAAGRADGERVARQRASELAPKVSHLTVSVPPNVQLDGLEVRRDKEVLGQGQWGSAVPVDPGKHVIAASAPGHADWTTTVEIAEGKSAVAEVPALVVVAAPPPSASATPESGPAEPQGGGSPAPSGGASTRRTIGLVVAGAGVVALGVGAYFGVDALSKNSDSNGQGCSGNACRQPGYDLRNQARTSGDIATVLLGAGAAAAVGGAVLWLTAGTQHGSGGRDPRMRVVLGPGALRLEGEFR
jgi:hypothetical protein